MTDYDDYFTYDDKPFSENLNSSLLLSNAFNMTVPIEIPKMFNDGSFANNTSSRKCGVAIVNLRTTLPSGLTINNNGEITGTGTIQLRFYPNFNNFDKIRSISWDDTEDITINLKRINGSTILSDINNGILESESEDLRKLQQIIIEIVFNNATLHDLKVVMQGKQSDRFGADVQVDNVTGLDTRLDDIKSKNNQQDNRLNDIESLDTTQNTRLSTIENTLDSIHNYNITLSNYKPKIDTDITVFVKITDKNGNIVPYTSVELTYSREGVGSLYPHNMETTTVTGQTNENGVATFTVNMNQWGMWDFQVEKEHCQIYVDGWRLILGSTSGTYQIYRNQTHGKFIIKKVHATTAIWNWKKFENGASAVSIRPVMPVVTPIASDDILIKIDGYGDIWYRAATGAIIVHDRDFWGQIEWEICDEDL